MKFMILVKATRSSEAGIMPEGEALTKLFADMGKYNEELSKAGILVEADGLMPSAKGARVRFSGANRSVMHGPFTETNELVAGYWIWKVKSLEEAIEWVKKCPNPMLEDSDIEIRPCYSADDFGEAFTTELREKEATLRAENLGLGRPEYRSISEINLVGLNETYSMETRVRIPSQWERFVGAASRLTDKGDFYGVAWNHQKDCSFDYLTGVAVKNLETPNGFVPFKIKSQKWAVFSHEGHVSMLAKTIDTIWSKWAPECGLKIAKAPCIEHYTHEFNAQTGLGGMYIWIGLED